MILPNYTNYERNKFEVKLELKENQGKSCFLDIVLMKYHQMFKSELECSFTQFSSDNTCSCEIHNFFGMMYRDISDNPEVVDMSNNAFFIRIDIDKMLRELHAEHLDNPDCVSKIENQLFFYYQNMKLGNKIDDDSEERAVNIIKEDNSKFLTFKLDFGDIYALKMKHIGYFLSLMPQYLNGEEFKTVTLDEQETIKSPRGELCCIIAYESQSRSYVCYIDIEGQWVMFQDEK